MLEESDPAYAPFDSDPRRPADHDGAHDRAEALFYRFRLEHQVPEIHERVPVGSGL